MNLNTPCLNLSQAPKLGKHTCPFSNKQGNIGTYKNTLMISKEDCSLGEKKLAVGKSDTVLSLDFDDN